MVDCSLAKLKKEPYVDGVSLGTEECWTILKNHKKNSRKNGTKLLRLYASQGTDKNKSSFFSV
uniref:Uncharacterized protein n=1 Tax=Arion vulgaris TaxID=1028688 RepID=A0A0B6Z4U5_9EUPU